MFFKVLPVILLLAISTKAFGNCSPNEVLIDSEGICYSFEYTKGPYINSPGEREFSEGIATLRSLSGTSLDSDPYFFIWMKMHGNHEHGGRPVVAESLGQNRYLVSEILLQKMTGQWFLRTDLNYSDPHSPRHDYDGEVRLTEWMGH